jgi:hypothetical protein
MKILKDVIIKCGEKIVALKRAFNKTFLIICILSLLITGCEKSDFNVAEVIGTDEMDVKYYTASFVIDETDLTQVTTYASYVFIAKVISYDKTEYLNGDAELPLTFYSVQVLENIKGNLITDENIELKKAGGLIKNSTKFSICQDDILPEQGGTYLFAAVIFDDDLYCPMPNMVVKLDTEDTNWSENEVVQRYTEALKQEVSDIPNGNQYKSKYDAEGN